MIKSLCVYCGASAGTSPHYADGARAFGRTLVEHDIALVYGGGNVGLMGVIADEVMRLGGEVTGVIPSGLLEKEVGHTALTRLYVVKDMHERKALMARLADGFVAMPGGIGTLEELFEMFTWSQLGLHDKPVGLLNIGGFYDGMLDFIDHIAAQGFLRTAHRELLLHESDGATLIARFKQYDAARSGKFSGSALIQREH